MNTYLGQINELLARDCQEFKVGSVSEDIGDEGLDVAGVALYLVQVGQLSLLVLQDLERLLEPSLESGSLSSELGELLQSPGEALDELVRVVGHIVVADLELLAIGLELVEFSGAEDVSSSLHKLCDDVKSVVDWSVVVINIILDLLHKKNVSQLKCISYVHPWFTLRALI